MSAIYFTLVGIALYFLSDWILDRAEVAAGRRFDYRTLIFCVILLSLSLTIFTVIQLLTGVSS